jgi:hypothetical protein
MDASKHTFIAVSTSMTQIYAFPFSFSLFLYVVCCAICWESRKKKGKEDAERYCQPGKRWCLLTGAQTFVSNQENYG